MRQQGVGDAVRRRVVLVMGGGLLVLAAFAAPVAIVPAAAVPTSSPELIPFIGNFKITATWGAPSGGYHAQSQPAIDTAMPSGTSIYAAGAGTVSFTAIDNRNCNPDTYPGGLQGCINDGYAGTRVYVAHPDGTSSRYLHLSGITSGISTGTPVAAGQLIAYSGNSGTSTGPHLHYEERNSGGGYQTVDTWAGCNGSTPITYDGMQNRKNQYINNTGYGCIGGALPTSNGGSSVRSAAYGRCLDVAGAATANGGRLQLWDCNGAAWQTFVVSGGALTVYGSPTKCLDADANAGGANGTKVQIWDCLGNANQQWTYAADGTIRSVAFGKCLDADGNMGGANGTKIQLWDCNGAAWQKWVGQPLPNGGAGIRSVASGRCIDIPNSSISPGALPQLWDCNGAAWQKWVREGSQLRVYGDKCLDVQGAGTANGTPVQIWYCSGAVQQQWSWQPDGTIRSTPSGKCLDAIGGGTANGTHLQIWDCNGAPWQQWRGVITNSALPYITGTKRVGYTLAAHVGVWSPGGLTYRYQWFKGATAISGATSRSYLLPGSARGYKIRVRVTAVRARYTTLAKFSPYTAAIS